MEVSEPVGPLWQNLLDLLQLLLNQTEKCTTLATSPGSTKSPFLHPALYCICRDYRNDLILLSSWWFPSCTAWIEMNWIKLSPQAVNICDCNCWHGLLSPSSAACGCNCVTVCSNWAYVLMTERRRQPSRATALVAAQEGSLNIRPAGLTFI